MSRVSPINKPFAAVHMAAIGTKPPSRYVRSLDANGGKAEIPIQGVLNPNNAALADQGAALWPIQLCMRDSIADFFTVLTLVIVA